MARSAVSRSRVALVTGATGFIGSNLSQRLLSEGWRVHALSRQLPAEGDAAFGLTWHLYDGRYESVDSALCHSRPDVVFHLASCFIPEHETSDLDPMLDSNVRFGMHLLEGMRQNQVRKLVNAGSSWQHFGNRAYDPVNLYAATKQAYEALVVYYCNAHDFRVITLSIYDTFGRQDKRKKIYNLLLNAIKGDKTLSLTDGLQTLSLVHVSDIARGFIEAFNRLDRGMNRVSHEKFGLFVDSPINLRDLSAVLQTSLGGAASLNWGVLKHRPRTMMSPPSIVERLPNWQPTIDVRDPTVTRSIAFN